MISGRPKLMHTHRIGLITVNRVMDMAYFIAQVTDGNLLVQILVMSVYVTASALDVAN